MKRYLLFSGSNYYPFGGWDDFKGDFDSREEALAILTRLRDLDWWHIVDTETRKVYDQFDK